MPKLALHLSCEVQTLCLTGDRFQLRLDAALADFTGKFVVQLRLCVRELFLFSYASWFRFGSMRSFVIA